MGAQVTSADGRNAPAHALHIRKSSDSARGPRLRRRLEQVCVPPTTEAQVISVPHDRAHT